MKVLSYQVGITNVKAAINSSFYYGGIDNMITLENVSKTFYTKKGQVTAVKNANLHIKEGEIHGVIGYSGAGKSTLIRCVNLLERPTTGKVYIKKDELTSLTTAQLREKRKEIGMIFQGFNLLQTATVYENIATPLKLIGVKKSDIKKRVDKYIEIVGLADRKNAYPAQLSGGQKQRVAIARALAQEPEILLSDEATSALDPETTESILDLLLKINEEFGITILLITHEMNVIQRVCDSVSVMEDGEVVEQDLVTNLFTDPQHETTKRFLDILNERQIANYFLKELTDTATNSIYHLTFTGQSTSQPIIASLTKKYDVSPNIINADVIQLKNDVVGSLVVHLDGAQKNVAEALQFLREQNIRIEAVEVK